MNALINDVIKFFEDFVIECEPNTGCGRCDDARKLVEELKKLLTPGEPEIEIKTQNNEKN